MSAKKKSSIIEMDDLRSFWKIFSQNWYIAAVFVGIAAILSYFYTYKLPEVYAAKSQILLKNEETYDYQESILKGIGYYEAYQDNINQMRVITSNDLIKKALSKLKIDISYFIVGRLKTTEVYESMPFNFSVKLLNAKLYEQKMKFKILNELQFQITYLKGEQEYSKTFPFNKEIIDSDFILSVNKNKNINNKTILSLKEIDYLVQIHKMSSLVAKFKNALSVENLENTTILEFTLEDEIPDRAITFLDTLSKVYIDYTAQAQYTISENTLLNIDKQLSEIVGILDTLEEDLENYKEGKAILDLSREENQYFSKLMEFDSKKRQTELTLQTLGTLEKYIIEVGNSKDEKLIPPALYIEQGDQYLRTTISELYSMQMDRNKALYGATEENAGIENLDMTMDLLKKNMLVYINNSKKAYQRAIEDYNQQIDSYRDIIRTIPKTQRELLAIERKAKVNENMYNFLLQKRSNTVIARAGILPQTSIIETAHSIGIVKPNKQKILYYYIVVGFVLALVIIFIRTVFFSTIDNIEELKRLTSLPVIGQIMLSGNENYIIVDKDPKAPVTESFRGIRTNLEYMASDSSGSRVILVTSYNPGEGKTFTSANLATIFAKANKKVLLLEMDLHKPKIQKALNMSSDIGVSTILIGKTNIPEAIMPTEIDNLSVILSGPTPPNASEIILSKHMKEIFEYGRNNFDYVIVDTAPVGLITDALVLMKHVDITLFVLNAKYAKKQVLEIVQEIVDANKLKDFGLILNGVKRKRSGYYYNYGYGYGYGYRYGYGYGRSGYGNETKK